MQLRSIALRDWKAFESARFDFPAASRDRNVILIGGQNGFGKTSMFEAIALGLFGRDGMPLIHRADIAGTEALRAANFRDFMRRALHGRALAQGRDSCRITLKFENAEGEPIEIARTFHYGNDGALRQRDFDQVHILFGAGRRPVTPGPDTPDPEAWYRDWVGKHFMPPHLAHFFLFDGQVVATFANREMQSQVHEGIKGLLGLPWLDLLADDLRKYALNRRGLVAGGVPANVERLQAEIAEDEKKLAATKDRLETLVRDLAGSEAERDQLTRDLAGYGTGTRAKLEELIAERDQHARAYGESRERLAEIVVADLPLALAGTRLRNAVVDQLHRERVRTEWLASVSRGQGNVDLVLQEVRGQLARFQPPLQPETVDAVSNAVLAALDRLWHPAPPEAAEAIQHPHATGDAGTRVQLRLEKAAALSRGALAGLLETMARAAQAQQKVQAEIDASQTAAPDLEQKKAKLKALNDQVAGLHQEKGELDAALRSLEPQLRQKRAELGREAEKMKSGERPVRLAKRAEQVAAMLDQLVADALPTQYEQVAQRMTEAIRAMAHRSDYLNQIRIDPDGSLRLLTPSRRNLREFDLSAGEKQVFTQALISAMVSVSGRAFPLIVDTPLGPLDDSHRVNVLRHLAARKSQVFLISTDTEVVGPYLEAIRPRVAKAYLLRNRRDQDLGITEPEEGYFPGQGL
jgi:DNA sulfur modification protein DndD